MISHPICKTSNGFGHCIFVLICMDSTDKRKMPLCHNRMSCVVLERSVSGTTCHNGNTSPYLIQCSRHGVDVAANNRALKGECDIY